jgi:hypothetical protein
VTNPNAGSIFFWADDIWRKVIQPAIAINTSMPASFMALMYAGVVMVFWRTLTPVMRVAISLKLNSGVASNKAIHTPCIVFLSVRADRAARGEMETGVFTE